MFRLEKERHISKTFRFPAELLSQLQALAQEKGMSLNKVIIRCCEYALENLEKDIKD